MNDKAQEILGLNCRDSSYTVPSKHLYPFQWNWDSCLTALGWLVFDEDRAWKEIETLFSGQWSSGKVPHIIFHQDVDTYFPGPEIWRVKNGQKSSGITQPPIAATCIRKMYEQSQDKELAKKKMISLIPNVYRYHQWFHQERDPEGTGLVAIYHPWESGRDNSAEWDMPLRRVPTDEVIPYKRRDIELVDPSHRPTNEEYDRYIALVQLFADHDYDHKHLYGFVPFKVADIGINSILLRANKDLLWLTEQIAGFESYSSPIKQWISLQENAFELLWCETIQAYTSLDLISNQHLEYITSGSFLSFYANTDLGKHEKPLLDHLNGIANKVKYMVPSLSPDNPDFDSSRYWRGPVWAIVNFLISDGLKLHGHIDLSKRVGQDTALLLQAGGLKEYFDPFTGEGLGGEDFSWTAAMWLAWAHQYSDDEEM
jgi:alpha,alpha-trehalase